MYRRILCVEWTGFRAESILNYKPPYALTRQVLTLKDSSEGQSSEKHIQILLTWPNEFSKKPTNKQIAIIGQIATLTTD